MRVVHAALAILLLPAIVAAAADDGAERRLARTIGDRTAGAPVDCINPHDARATQVIAGRAIVYDEGTLLYVNRPKGGAERLRPDSVLVIPNEGGQLCRLDTITLLDPVTRMQTGFVVLDRFVPYRARR